MNRLSWIGACLTACLLVVGAGVPAMAMEKVNLDSINIVGDDSAAWPNINPLKLDAIDIFDDSAAGLMQNALDLKSPIMLVAVESISALCRAEYAGTGYQRDGGFCDVAFDRSSLVKGSPRAPCPPGYIDNPAPPPKCILDV